MIHLTDSQIVEARSILTDSNNSTAAEIRQAFLILLPSIDHIMLGICASSWTDGILALEQYSRAFDLPILLPTPELTGAIYIKYNPRLPNCYASAYNGTERGVLVAAQSEDLTKLNEMFGHLPLDLFADK